VDEADHWSFGTYSIAQVKQRPRGVDHRWVTTAQQDLDNSREIASSERRSGRSVSQRASTLRRLAFVWSLGLLGLATVAAQETVPVEDLFLDASVVGGGHWYAGLVTSFAVMGWTIAAVSLGFCCLASRMSGRQNAALATGSIGLIVTLLLFDDLFLLHTNVVPKVLGGSKWLLIGLEAIAILVWSIRWKSEIIRTRWELLLAAAAGFGASLVFDRFPVGGDWTLVAEDGAKVLGVFALATWAVSTAADLIGSMVRRAPASPSPVESEEVAHSSQ